MIVLNIDWLTLYVDTSNLDYGRLFDIKHLDYGTRQYRKITEFSIQGERICTLCHEPASTILKENTGLLKFDNQVFYKHNYRNFLTNTCEMLGLKIINISRFDLALDFELFDNGMSAQTLISQFLANEVWKIGTQKYRCIGHQNDQHHHDYLRFGSNSSDCCVYLYNKSLEMREVKQKNYILAWWKNAKMGKDRDVWRLEVSVKGNNIKTLGYKNDNQRNFEIKDLLDFNNRHEIFYQFITKYFDFRINDGQARKDRMKRLNLFKYTPEYYEILIGEKHNTTGRSDKIFIKKCEEVFNELRQNKSISQKECRKMLEKYIQLCGLTDWYANKTGTVLKDDNIVYISN